VLTHARTNARTHARTNLLIRQVSVSRFLEPCLDELFPSARVCNNKIYIRPILPVRTRTWIP